MIINSFALYRGYKETIVDEVTGEQIPNPETRAQFDKRMVINYIRETIKSGMAGAEADTARHELDTVTME